MAFEPQRIGVTVKSFSIEDVWQIQQEVTVEGGHIKDGSYTTTITIPLEKPKKKVISHLIINEPGPGFTPGHLYTANDHLTYVAKDNLTLVNTHQLLEIERYFSPTYVVVSGVSQSESASS